MDVQSIFEAGGTIIKNPNYSKSRKNTQPEYIRVSDLNSGVQPTSSAVAGIVYDAAASGNQDILGRNGELDKYIKAGLTPNDWQNLDKELAESQSAWTKWGNALAQTIVSEIGLGTALGFSNLFDIIGQATTLSSPDYTNPVSQFLEEKQKEFKEFAPIYTTPGINIGNGGLTDAGWWASNLPSVMSSLTLLLPSIGVTKSISMLGKGLHVGARARRATAIVSGASRKAEAAKIAKEAGKSAKEIAEAGRLNKFQRFLNSPSTAKETSLFLENTSTALLSRTLENYQEARQTYNDMYAEASDYFKTIGDEEYNVIVYQNKELLKREGVDPNDKDAVAAAIAKEAADKTFQMDWMNAGFDVIQMYALRNAWKGITNAPVSSAKIRRKNLDQAKYFGKTEAEIAAIKKKRGFLEKAKEWTGDRLYASKFVIGAQLSEGAEEAVNHIASQEGMRFGNILLGREKGDRKAGFWGSWNDVFDNRLSDYATAPELWESAFWGVAGGIIFQAGGNKLNRLKNKIGNKSEASEEAKSQLPWYKLDELPEIKRRLADIEARQIDFQDYKEQLDRINNGIDIESSTEGNEVKFESDIQQSVAREKLRNQFISKMTLRAMRNGNLNLLKSFLANDNVRRGMIDAGMFGKHEANMTTSELEADMKQYNEEVLAKVEEVERMFDEELVAVNDAASEINAGNSYKNQIDADYIQIIANNNINARLNLQDNERERAAVDEEIADREELYRDKLDQNVDHAGNIRLFVLTNELGKLRAKRRKILNQNGDKLSTEVALHNVDKQIEDIESKLDDAELQWATFKSLRYTEDDNGRISQGEDSNVEAEAFAYRDMMIIQATEENEGKAIDNELFKKLGLSRRATTQLSKDKLGRYNTLEQDTQNSATEVKKVSERLNNLYEVKAALEISGDYYRSRISRSKDEVAYEAGILHNTMNEARIKAIDDAFDVISDLYKKYGSPIEDVITDELYGTHEFSKEFLESIPKKDRDTLKFYLDVLALNKGHNQILASTINNRLRHIDDLNRSDIDNQGETSEETAPEESSINETLTTNPPVEGNTAETSTEPKAEDPQNIEGRIPSYYANFRNNNGNLISYNHTSEDNGSAAIYDNGDDTFTIDVRDNAKLKHDTRMFSNADEVDLTRPHEVVSMPIAKRNNKGKLEIIQQGELRNTDSAETIEQKEEKAAADAQAQINNGVSNQPSQATVPQQPQNGTPINNAGQENGQSTPSPASLSSNGGRNSETEPQVISQEDSKKTTDIPTPEKKAIEIMDVGWTEAPKEDNVYLTALTEIMNEYKADKSVDLDSFVNSLIENKIKGGVDRSIAEPAINKAYNAVKRIIAKRSKAKEQNFNSSVDELIISQSAMLVSGKNQDAISMYQSAVQTMISYYAKEFGLNQINGKYYISLENLLRYINQSTKDSSMANALYDSLKTYITSEEGKKLYGLTDELTATREDAISNIAKSRLQRFREKIDNNREFRVDIKSLLNNEDSDVAEAALKAFNSLNVNDKLTFKVVEDKLIIYAPNGEVVGSMAIPSIGSTSGSYHIYQTGWQYDLIKYGGEVQGDIKEVLSKWINPKTDAAREINDIIRELAYGNPSEKRRKELNAKFENNEEFKRAKKLSLVSKKATIEQLTDGLIGIWKYAEVDETAPDRLKEAIRKESINSWFDKLYEDYSTILQIARQGKKVEMTVSTISEGELITVELDKALPASKAIAEGINLDNNKVIISNPRVRNDIIVSGKGHISDTNMAQGNTGVLIPTNSGKIRFAHAYPVETTAEQLGKDAKEIVQAVHDQIDKLIDEFRNNPSEESFYALRDFIESVTSNNRGISSLFRGLSFTEYNKDTDKHFFSIAIKDPNRPNRFSHEVKFFKKSARSKKYSNTIVITNPEFPVNERGRNELNYNTSDEEGRKYLHEILNNLMFRIDVAYLDSDNVSDKPLNGVASKNNGKFIIKIGDKTWEFSSYNEFLLNNDVLNLTTVPSEDGKSNFRPRAEQNNKNNVQLKVKISEQITPPVEENDEAVKDNQPTTNLTVSQKVTNILNSNSENKGVEIAEAVVGTIPNISPDVIKSFKDLGILPKNIIFDENFNSEGSPTEKMNASVSRTTGVVTVGKVWFDLFNNPSTRGRAIRILIHEQLHNKLRKNEGYVRSAKAIYDEFEDALNKGKINGERTPEQLKHLREYLFKSEKSFDRALEEFLVESLTNEELASALNDIDAKVPTKRGKNLFQKILELMSKVFGWDVRKGSLYEKELKTLRNLDKVTSKTTTKKVNKKVKVTSKVQGIQLSLFDNETDTLEEANAKFEATKAQKPVVEETTEEPKIDEKQADEKPIDVKEEISKTNNEDEFAQVEDDGSFDDFDSSVEEMSYTQKNIYTPEMQAIKDKAIADGTFMKAPNGKPTNLNERQWLQVRTKNFINWFGDWINNPKEASKVVDENGEPLVVYHGTNIENISIFNSNKSDQTLTFTATNRIGNFFTDNQNEAQSYGNVKWLYNNKQGKPTVYSLFLNIKNPLYFNNVAEFRNYMMQDFEYDSDGNPISNVKIPKEYDGVYVNQVNERNKAKELVAFDSNQIKSATSNTGAFSTTNDDIRYSSVEELPSIPAFAERLPVSQQAVFASAVNSADISTSCK